MNYQQAEALMQAGKKVRLSDWLGYWFMEDGVLKVFTRTGDILTTPFVERYRDRDDWEEVTEGLGFEVAILAVKAGKRIARAGWNGKRMFVFMRPADSINIRTVVENVKSLPQSVKDFIDTTDDRQNPGEFGLGSVKFGAYLCMYAADGSIVNGWMASQTDLLATDWVVLS
jgi:hypothetical protein